MLKTPMTLVNELCTRNEMIPSYRLIKQTDGAERQRGHYCDLVISGAEVQFKVTGKGRTKQGAKHSAAYEALKRILTEENSLCKIDIDMEKVRSPHAYESDENYLKKLKDLCIRNMLPIPEYLTTGIEDDRGFKSYTIQCKVSTVAESVKSHSKKFAKQCASKLMIKKLLSISKINLIVNVDDYNGYDINTAVDRYRTEGENCNIDSMETDNIPMYSKINISDYHKVSILEEEFFPVCYAVGKKLDDGSVDTFVDPKSFVEDICRISDIRFQFFPIGRLQNRYDDETNEDMHIVVLKLFTCPSWVLIGRGADLEEAKCQVSRKMLTFLKDLVVDRIEE